jgi:uncharacterized protein (TIGR00296 family)
MPYSINDGERMIKAARAAVELHLSTTKFNIKSVERYMSDLYENAAVFVTLEHFPTGTPRGSSGYVKAEQPLHQAVVNAAVASTEDMRYVPVSHLEFEHLIVEVSLLSQLERITSRTKASVSKAIMLGRHGLHIEYGYHSATFLPQFIIANGWSVEEALDELCIAAGLKEHLWKSGSVKLFKFTTQRFREISPRGPVEEITTE